MSKVDILIVDDRPEDILVVCEILRSADYNLVTASSGTEALKRILERDFALILLDVLMPDMDGFEVAAHIKTRPRSRHTPIIFLTAAGADMKSIYKGYSVGAVDYLSKPLDPDVVCAKVAIFAELARKDRQIREQAAALRAAERAQNERRYRNLAEAIPQIVWTADSKGGVTYVNQRWREFTGQPPDDALATGWMDCLHPDDTADVATRWAEAVEQRNVLALEFRLRAQDGTYRWFLCRAVPELGDAQELLGWLGTYTDFDEKKRMLDAAREAVHARDEFLSVASHELRTPLMTLQLRLDTIEEDLRDLLSNDMAMKRKVGSAIRQGKRLMSLVESLIDVSRIARGQLTLQKERFDLAEATAEVVEQFTESVKAAGCTVDIRVETPVHGEWDRVRVEQMLQNLLTNAIKYAPRTPIEVVVRADGRTATLIVRDRGMGINPEDLDRIFGRFERAVSTRHYGGLGLGLFITREIAHAHGGAVHVTSEPGAGSTFTVELPLDQAG